MNHFNNFSKKISKNILRKYFKNVKKISIIIKIK